MEPAPPISTREFTRGKTRSVDSLRGIAVILMLSYHFLVWLLRISARGYFFRADQVLATFFAPAMFFTITGITLTFSVGRRQLQGDSTGKVARYVLERYGGLMLIGFALNVVLWGPRSFWIWDVLEVIGLCNIIAFFVSLVSSDLLMLGVGLLGLASYYVALSISFSPFWNGILHNPLKGTFPIGPFLFFTLVGFVLGKRLVRIIQSEQGVKACNLCLQSGGVLLLLSLLLHISGVAVSRYPVSVSYALFATGTTMLALGALFWWQDLRGIKASLLRPVMMYGRYALAIYIVHYLAYRAFKFLDVWGRLDLWVAIAAAVVLLGIILGSTICLKPDTWKQMV